VSRDPRQRLLDIQHALVEIDRHLGRGPLDDGLVFDAVRIRLVEIGEAVSRLDASTMAEAPDVPWRDIAAMRNHLIHRYFDTAHAIVAATVHNDLSSLRHHVGLLLADD
jgi:uncharacterized protein with HEPN domain